MRNKFRMALLALATVGLFSCSDKLADDVTPSEDGTTGYVAFKISTVTDVASARGSFATRADGDVPDDADFSEGDRNEYEITSTNGANVVFFFNDSGDYVTTSVLEIVGGPDGSKDNTHDNTASEKKYQARINKGNTSVKQCLLVLNGNPATLDKLKNKSLTELLAEIDGTDMGYGEQKYFTMTNCVYLDSDGTTIKTATPIDPATQICSTQEQANNNPIIVHVERILAKFELLSGTTSISGGTLIEPTATAADDDANTKITIYKKNDEGAYVATTYPWAANIIGWNVNATETQTYWFKNLTNTDGKFGKWDKDIAGSQFGWNDVTRLRSYWAVDPHYNTETAEAYPQQYRKALDEDVVCAEGGSNFVLNYYSYNNLKANPAKYRYAVENTFDYNWFESGEPDYDFAGDDYKRTDTHFIVAAELQVKGTDEKYANPGTLYQYDSYYWEADKLAEGTSYSNYNDMPVELKKTMLKQLVFEWEIENGSLYKDENAANRFGDGESDYDYFSYGKAQLKGGDGRVMMTLKTDASYTLYYKDGDETKKLEGDKLAKFTNDYLYVYGSARRFNSAAMYYSIPIRHMVAIGKDDDGVAKYYNVGSYGVVRNHWYKATISKITKPGTSVDDPDQPIIPNDDPDAGGYAAFEVVIVPWHYVKWDAPL